jgi:hypothetical protein
MHRHTTKTLIKINNTSTTKPNKVVAGRACEVMITYQLSVDLVATLGATGGVRDVLPVLLDPQADEAVVTAAASCSRRCCTIHGCCLKFSLLPRAHE